MPGKKNTVTREMIIDEVKTYISNPNSLKLINDALDFAYIHHEGQLRKSGEPYVIHLLNVGYILASMHVGPTTICAGILHDTIEDTGVLKEELAEKFGTDVAEIVESVTKIGNINFKDVKEYQAANHRKIFIAMAKDVRVILVKLVDRLHNMRTLEFMSEEKQKRISSETLEVYAPIAHRLGLNNIKNELEDLSFFYLNRDEYYHIAYLVEAKKTERDAAVNIMIDEISQMLSEHGIEFRIFGRSKHLYSIYKKMKKKNKRFEEILDLLAIRIVTKTELNCYETLGYIHAKYRPIPGRLKDYIAMPKQNMYQSLHTTIVGEEGRIFEVQIRTEEMDSIAEKGVAAHWRYKEGSKYDARKEQREIEEKLSWLKEFAALTLEEEETPNALMDTLTKDIFEANVYCMTPNGRVIDLPNGSTPIDFAYRVHTDVGHYCVGAVVNELLVPLNTPLKTGDVVQIRTSKQSNGPSEDWLKIVKTNQARNKIKNFLTKKENEAKAEKIELGEKMLIDELKKRNFDPKEFVDKKKIEAIAGQFQTSTYNEVMYALAVKSINMIALIEKLTNQKRSGLDSDEFVTQLYNNREHKKKDSKTGLRVNGVDSMMMSLAQCCCPVYGDEITGFVSKGKGVKVHLKTCKNIIEETNRLIEVYWDEEASQRTYETNIIVRSYDRNFLLTDIVTIVSQCRGSIINISCALNKEELTATTKMTVQVKDMEHLHNIMANIRKVDCVYSVDRQML